MDRDLIYNLHQLSTLSVDIPLEKTHINRLIYIDNEFCKEEFLDLNSFLLQDELLNAKDNKIEIILKNLNTAIETSCNNGIDLTNLLSVDKFQYSITTNLKEKRVSNMYNVISKFPLDDDLFKKYWLKIFIDDCTKIVKNINTILNKEKFNLEDCIVEKQKKSLKTGIYNEEDITVVPEQSTNNIEVIEQSSLNDFTRSTIIEYLEDIIEDINPVDYGVLVDALYCYFTTSEFPKLERKIIFKRVNKKKVGWALKEVYKNVLIDNLNIEYFRFAQENINLFANEVIEAEGFLQGKFYKSFTTKPTK